MSNKKLLILFAGLFFSIPILFLILLLVWFETNFTQLEAFEDTRVVTQDWEIGEALNTCKFDFAQEKILETRAHPNEIWERTPKARQKGYNAHLVTEPNGATDRVYAGFIVSTERVFINYKENDPKYDIYVKNSLSFLFPRDFCDRFR